MKKLAALILAFVLSTSFVGVSAGNYELWVESPVMASGYTLASMNMYRSKKLGDLQMFPLSSFGSNYYLAVCPEKYKSGSKYYSYLYFYVTIKSGNDFIVVADFRSPYEVNYGYGIDIVNLASSVTDVSWYNAKSSEIPRYVITPRSTTNYYAQQIVLTNALNTYSVCADSYQGTHSTFTAYNGLLHDTKYKKNGSNYYKLNGQNAGNLRPCIFKDGKTTYDPEFLVIANDMTIENGFVKTETYGGTNVTEASTSFLNRTSTFADGRQISASWTGLGGGIYEVWYTVSNASGTAIAKAATSYSGSYSSSFDLPELWAFPINNTKFIVCVNQVQQSFFKEFSRIAVAEDTANGEVLPVGGGVGTKNITPPADADTIPINPQIDFGENNLPLGFNLNPTLKNDYNAIVLPDIVILKKSGYVSGVNNTGNNLDTYSYYDYSMGSSYVRFYSNGFNFNWTCSNPENLTVGTHNKSFVVGDKTIYLKVKVIAQPTNTGTTNVTF